jgi:hypothetical protein
LVLTRIIREGDEGTPSPEFFEAEQGKQEAAKWRKRPQGSFFSSRALPDGALGLVLGALSPGKQKNGWEKNFPG